MSLLARTLLALAALSLCSTAGVAKEIKGAPKVLIGEFGKSPAQCRSYNRDHDNITTFYAGDDGKYYYSDCLGKQCTAEVLSHQVIRTGFVLKLNYVTEFSNTVETFIVRRLKKNNFHFHEGNESPQRFIRCTQKDAIAGIGLQPESAYYDGDYKVYYSLAVPKLCPSLEVDIGLATNRLGNKPLEVDEVVQRDVEKDLRDIPRFCKEVLGAFGKNGRVIPNLLRVSRQKN